MPVRGLAGARLRIVLAAVEQDRLHAGLARGVELLDHVRKKQHVARREDEGLGAARSGIGRRGSLSCVILDEPSQPHKPAAAPR